jgi:hypothetical protein
MEELFDNQRIMLAACHALFTKQGTGGQGSPPRPSAKLGPSTNSGTNGGGSGGNSGGSGGHKGNNKAGKMGSSNSGGNAGSGCQQWWRSRRLSTTVPLVAYLQSMDQHGTDMAYSISCSRSARSWSTTRLQPTTCHVHGTRVTGLLQHDGSIICFHFVHLRHPSTAHLLEQCCHNPHGLPPSGTSTLAPPPTWLVQLDLSMTFIHCLIPLLLESGTVHTFPSRTLLYSLSPLTITILFFVISCYVLSLLKP